MDEKVGLKGKGWIVFLHNTIKDSHRFGVQGSDTTMMTMAASSFGQQNLNLLF